VCPSEVSDIDDNLYNGELGEAGVIFWAISDEREDTLADFRTAFDIDMPLLLDANQEAQRQYQGTMAFPTAAFPQTYVVDPQGKLVYYNNVHDIDELAAVLEDLVAGE
jgi:peroxiredoxin